MGSIEEFALGQFASMREKKIGILQHPNDFIPFMDFTLEYLKDRKTIRFLEIGILFGGSFKITGECIKHAGHDVFGVAVDLQVADSRFGGINVPDIPASLKALNLDFPYEMIVGNSHDQEIIDKVKTFAPFDLVFIDGDHTVDGHMADRNNYIPMTNGLMAFHDLAEPDHAVKNNWPNIRHGYKFWEFKFCDHYGIGVIQVGNIK